MCICPSAGQTNKPKPGVDKGPELVPMVKHEHECRPYREKKNKGPSREEE
jgi:hypothetical protein